MNAEKDARLYAEQEGREEVTVDEIYDILARRNHIPEELIKRIKECEIQTEIESMYPIEKNIELLKKFKSEGKHIVLISDMYLSEAVIRKILLKSDSVFLEIPIYVSSEMKKTKRSGSLYFEIAKIEKEEFSTWKHFGDKVELFHALKGVSFEIEEGKTYLMYINPENAYYGKPNTYAIVGLQGGLREVQNANNTRSASDLKVLNNFTNSWEALSSIIETE